MIPKAANVSNFCSELEKSQDGKKKEQSFCLSFNLTLVVRPYILKFV